MDKEGALILSDERNTQRTGQQAPLERFLSHPALPHLIIEGDPGAGKTVLLEHVAFILACSHLKQPSKTHQRDLEVLRGLREAPPIPILLKASALGTLDSPPGIQRLTDAVCAEFNTVNGQSPDRALVLAALQQGRYLVMVDALDEVPSQEQRNDVLAILREVAANDSLHLRTVLTTRPTEFTGILLDDRTRGRMRELRVALLDRECSDAIMARWCEAHQKDDTYRQKMSDAIHEAGRKHAARFSGNYQANFLENPMLLTSAMLVYLGQGGLPEDTVSLYRDMVDILCKSRKNDISPEDRQEALKILAKILQTRRVTRLDLDLVAEAFQSCNWHPDQYSDLIKIKELFMNLGDQTGLLRFEEERADDRRIRRVIRFWHRSFQEYLCARALATRKSKIKLNGSFSQCVTTKERSATIWGQMPYTCLRPL